MPPRFASLRARRCATLSDHARPAPHAADDPAQHAVPGDGVSHRLPAPARGRARPYRDPGGSRRSGCSCAVLAALVERMAGELRRRARAASKRELMPPPIAHFLAHAERYVETVEPAIRFLQGRDPSLALRIVGRAFLPEGPRFAHLRPPPSAQHAEVDEHLRAAFGALGATEQARYLASLYVDDLADVWRDGIDPRFELVALRREARRERRRRSIRCARRSRAAHARRRDCSTSSRASSSRAQRPDVVGDRPRRSRATSTARSAWRARSRAAAPNTTIVLGGGWVNTELRALREPRVVRLLRLRDARRRRAAAAESADAARGHGRAARAHLRARGRRGRARERRDAARHPDTRHGTPTYDGLPLIDYVSVLEMLNPMHRLWSDGRWNKLTLAHGCYWKKCSSATSRSTTSAATTGRRADLVVRAHRALVDETGQTGFHFVDEAAPPAGLRALAKRLHRATSSRSPGGATSASRRRSRPSSARCSPSPAASP